MATKQILIKEKQTAPTAKPTSGTTPFIFDRTNYLIMAAGVVIILIGFMLMSGGGTSDPNIFPKEEIYSFRRITLAPIVVLIGFLVEAFAIFKKT
jgi:hypothetical protein